MLGNIGDLAPTSKKPSEACTFFPLSWESRSSPPDWQRPKNEMYCRLETVTLCPTRQAKANNLPGSLTENNLPGSLTQLTNLAIFKKELMRHLQREWY